MLAKVTSRATAHDADSDTASAVLRRFQSSVYRALFILQSDSVATRGVAMLLHVLMCLQVRRLLCPGPSPPLFTPA
jgi:hypothetical protein